MRFFGGGAENVTRSPQTGQPQHRYRAHLTACAGHGRAPGTGEIRPIIHHFQCGRFSMRRIRLAALYVERHHRDMLNGFPSNDD